jgi:hypothetical protein
MLEHWIQPLDSSAFFKDYLDADRIGTNLASLTEKPKAAGTREIALIGVDSRWAKFVRRHLYQFTYRMSDSRIYDLGDLRRSDPDFMIGPLVELISSDICPILIGGQFGAVKALRQSFAHLRLPFHPVAMHERLPEALIAADESATVIGVQQHLVQREIPPHMSVAHLSNMRNIISNAEPIIRDSNCTIFDFTSMTMADMPAQKSGSSSGFCTEEACVIMRYAGLHSGTRAVVLSGHDPMSLQMDLSANTTAQLIWYFMEAYCQSVIEDPLNSPHCTTYAMHLDEYDTDLKFFKSERTGRWWVQMNPSDLAQAYPCTFQDYQLATNGQVSDRLVACAQASMKGSKQQL